MTFDRDPPSSRRRALLQSVAGIGFLPGVAAGYSRNDRLEPLRTTATDSPAWEWTDDHAGGVGVVQALASTQSGTIACAGFETDAAGTQHILLREVDHGGRGGWAETIGGRSGADAALGVTVTGDGDIVFCGGTGSRGSTHLDTAIGRFEPPDTLQWLTPYGRSGTNDAAHAIVQAPGSGFVVAGGTHYQGGASGDGVGRLLSIGADGTTRWDETYETAYAGECYDVVRTGNNEYAFAGTRATAGSDDGHAWLGVVDAQGTRQWSETHGGAGSQIAYSVVEAHDGGFVFAGTTRPPGSESSAWVGKVNATGSLEWEENYGTPGSDAAVEIERKADGGYVVAGWTGDAGWLLHLDGTGRIDRQETYGGSGGDRFNAVVRAGGEYVAGGYTTPAGSDPKAWGVGVDGAISPGDRLIVDADAGPGDPEYAEIQAAVDDAPVDATIEVLAGTYEEAVTIDETVTITTDEGAVLGAPDPESESRPGFEIDTESAADVEPTISGLTVDGFSPAIDFSGTSGDWALQSVTLQGTGDGTVVDARDTRGDWRIDGPSTLTRGRYGIRAGGSDGDWRVHRTNFVDIDDHDIRVPDADADSKPVGNARRNWFDGDSPACDGTIRCGNPLGEPASDDATGIEIELLDATGDDDPEPVPNATVYLLDTSRVDVTELDRRYPSFERYMADLDGQELLFNDTLPDRAERTHETGPDGLVRYTGLESVDEYCLVVEPPAHHSGDLWTAIPELWDRSVREETVALTSETHFDYLVEKNVASDATLQSIVETLEDHIDERRTAVLEEGFAAADVLDDALLDIGAEEGATMLADELVSYTAEQFKEDPDSLADGVQGVVSDLAFDASVNALSNALVAGMLNRIVMSVRSPDEAAARYQRYIADLGAVDGNWFNRPHQFDSNDHRVDHAELETYRGAKETVRNATSRIDDVRDEQPPAELNHEHVLEVFRQLEETLSDPAGIGDLERNSAYPTDIVILPDGTVRNTQRGAGHLPSLEAISEEYADKSYWDKIGLGADVVGFVATVGLIGVGVVKIVVPEPGTTIAGTALVLKGTAKIAGTTAALTDLGAAVDDLSDEGFLLLRYMDLHMDTLHDIDTLGQISEDVVGWLEGQYDDPTTGAVDGEIEFAGNGFDTTRADPLELTDALSDDDEMELAAGEIAVNYETTGEETVPGRVFGFSSYFKVRPHESRFPRLQGFTTTEPPANEEPAQFYPGSGLSMPIEYQFHQPVDDPFRIHFYSVHLVLEGRHVDTATTEAFVEEEYDDSWGIFGAEASQSDALEPNTDSSSQLRPYTTAATPTERPMTAPELAELRGDATTILDEKLAPGETASRSAPIPGRAESASFMLFIPPGTEAHLRIEDESGESVSTEDTGPNDEFAIETEIQTGPGGKQISLLPDDDATVTVTASVPTDRSQPVSVTVVGIEIPERPPVLGTKPAQLELFGAPDQRLAQRFQVTEVGNQQAIEEIEVTPESLTNTAGTELPTDSVSIEDAVRRIEPSDGASVRLIADPPETIDLTDEPSRFDGDVVIDTENAGTRHVSLSLLLLDTSIDGVDLVTADNSVSRVALTAGELDAGTPEPTGEVRTVYTITVEGAGTATLKLGDLLADTSDETVAMRLNDEAYEPAEIATGSGTGLLELPTGEHTIVVIDQPPSDGTDDDGGESDDGGEQGERGDADDSGEGRDDGDAERNDDSPPTDETAEGGHVAEDESTSSDEIPMPSPAELAGIGAVSAGMLYLGVRMLSSDGPDE